MKSPHIRSIALDLILTLITCFIWNIWVQYKQILATNAILKQEKYSFFMWAILTFITCGLYHFYHEFRMSKDLAQAIKKDGDTVALFSILLIFFGLSPIVDAIQQSDINAYFGDNQL